MNAERLVARRRDRWARYADLLARVQKGGLRAVPSTELRELARLYRETTGDLARLRLAGGDPEIEHWLERLVAGGHNLLYRAGGEGPGRRGVLEFLREDFPRLVRRSAGALAAATAVWLLGVVLAWSIASLRPDLARDLAPQTYHDRAETAVALRAAGEDAVYLSMPPTFMPLFSSTLLYNNVQATFVAFALGVTAGVGTALVLFVNGALFGAVAAVFAREGVASVFWTFVAAHGPVEIPAFLIAGAAGLRLGGAILRPGARRRRDALVHEAMDAGRLLGGTTVLLAVAALIEGFVSPAALPAWVKVSIGLGAGAATLVWITLGGRTGEDGGDALLVPVLGDASDGAAPVR